jgi:Protein of unknown function (DUF1838)
MFSTPRRILLVASLLTTLWGCATSTPPTPPKTTAADTSSAAGQLDSFMRMRAGNDGREVFANWWVTMFAVVPGEKPREIMRLEGYNVGRFIKAADGSAQFVSREVAYYRDLKTGEILTEWLNPFTGEKNTVIPVANDPVNSRYAAPKAGEAGRYPFAVSGDDVFLRLDVPLAYPNALLPNEYPAESSGPMYLASEHFTFFAKSADLNNAQLNSVPITYAWARTGPWLPWMKMGTRAGYLMYSGHGKKFANFTDLPADIQAYTKANYPLYLKAPDTYVTPNETSWTYYKKLNPLKK